MAPSALEPHAAPPDDQGTANGWRGQVPLGTEAAPPASDGAVGHDPGEADRDRRDQRRPGREQVEVARRVVEGRQDGADLQADQDEGQHVHHENDGLPDRVGREA